MPARLPRGCLAALLAIVAVWLIGAVPPASRVVVEAMEGLLLHVRPLTPAPTTPVDIQPVAVTRPAARVLVGGPRPRP